MCLASRRIQGQSRPPDNEQACPLDTAVRCPLLADIVAASTSRTAPEAEPAAPSAARRGVGGAFVAEWQRVLAIRGAFLLLVAPLVYGIYYPQPYLNQILRKTPIAVVDNDLSELSRSIVQTLDASGAR